MLNHLQNGDDYCNFLLDLPSKNFQPDPPLLDKYLWSSTITSLFEFSIVTE